MDDQQHQQHRAKTYHRRNEPCMKSSTTAPVVVPTTSIIERGKRIKFAAEIGLVRSSRDRHWGRALRRRLLRKTSTASSCGSCKLEAYKKAYNKFSCKKEGGGDEEDEEVAVEKKVRALQRLVPGGETLEIDKLFEETADYIEALEEQVSVMRTLANFLGHEFDQNRDNLLASSYKIDT